VVEDLRATGNQIQMTVGQGIKAARVNGFDDVQDK
jgi:hypothetical protein